jgi:uncharacterized protein (TIGR02996 family)
MNEGDGLLDDIIANPDDDGPRLVYADWVEEHGQDERGEIIRVQCRLAQLPAGSAEAKRLAKREKQLLKAHGAEWCDTHLGMVGELRRGFIEHVTTWPHNFTESGGELVQNFPVRSLRLRVDAEDADALRKLARAAHLGRVRHLSFQRATAAWVSLGDNGLRALLGSPHLGGLRTLDLGRCTLTDTGVTALARSALPALEELELGGNLFTTVSVEALAGAGHLGNLRVLGLAGARLRPVAGGALAASTALRRLRGLDLSGTRLGTTGVLELTRTHFLASVEVLDLGKLALSAWAARALARCSCLGNVRDLELRDNRLGDAGAELLAGSDCLKGIERLGLRNNGLTPAGVAALGESGRLGKARLDLAGNFVSGEEREQLRARFGKRFGKF